MKIRLKNNTKIIPSYNEEAYMAAKAERRDDDADLFVRDLSGKVLDVIMVKRSEYESNSDVLGYIVNLYGSSIFIDKNLCEVVK